MTQYLAEYTGPCRQQLRAFVINNLKVASDGAWTWRFDARGLVRWAAGHEDGAEKNVVTPGPVMSARELLGEMLLEMQQAAATLKEFGAAMQKEPNAFAASMEQRGRLNSRASATKRKPTIPSSRRSPSAQNTSALNCKPRGPSWGSREGFLSVIRPNANGPCAPGDS